MYSAWMQWDKPSLLEARSTEATGPHNRYQWQNTLCNLLSQLCTWVLHSTMPPHDFTVEEMADAETENFLSSPTCRSCQHSECQHLVSNCCPYHHHLNSTYYILIFNNQVHLNDSVVKTPKINYFCHHRLKSSRFTKTPLSEPGEVTQLYRSQMHDHLTAHHCIIPWFTIGFYAIGISSFRTSPI